MRKAVTFKGIKGEGKIKTDETDNNTNIVVVDCIYD